MAVNTNPSDAVCTPAIRGETETFFGFLELARESVVVECLLAKTNNVPALSMSSECDLVSRPLLGIGRHTALGSLVDTSPDQESIRSRFRQILDSLLTQGTTQQAIAAAVGVPPQYLSDLKTARKNVTELFARRLAEGYRFDYRWLMTGEGHPPQFLTPGVPDSVSAPILVRLRVFDHPIYGSPEKAPEWNGAFAELTGVAAAQASTASMPYIVRFGKNDIEGRLRRKDLVLVSQSVNAKADIHVVRCRRNCYFARRKRNGTYRRIAGESLGPEAEPVGHCVGIVWGLL